MAQASSTIVIDTPAGAIWQVISDFGSAGDYLAGMVDCRVEGDGIGQTRVLTAIDGSTVVERLELVDVPAQRLSYSLLTDTPFGDCLTTMSIRDLGPIQAELAWSASFRPVGIPTSEAVDLMEGSLAENCLTLKQFMESRRYLS